MYYPRAACSCMPSLLRAVSDNVRLRRTQLLLLFGRYIIIKISRRSNRVEPTMMLRITPNQDEGPTKSAPVVLSEPSPFFFAARMFAKNSSARIKVVG